MPMTQKIRTVLSTMVENASASSAKSPVTIQQMPHLSSLQALLTTAEDQPTRRAPVSILALHRTLAQRVAPLFSSDVLPGQHLTCHGRGLGVQCLI
ncbi:FXYD domain-containing ion transport regulator 3 isoform X1 [Cavia porcellus]|uniref:FXYD domain-containing ion transport regulator 3 isoform X1 n=1 Tax=Cavia porcellus TaxID=10141 RepID=UPI002FE3B25C